MIGAAASRDVVRLVDFLRRNGHPHRVLDPAVDPAAADVVARLSPVSSELPLVIRFSRPILRPRLDDHQLSQSIRRRRRQLSQRLPALLEAHCDQCL